MKRHENMFPKEDLDRNVPATSSLVAADWKQPKCPSTGEQINKLRHVYTMEYYLVIIIIIKDKLLTQQQVNLKSVCKVKEARNKILHNSVT